MRTSILKRLTAFAIIGTLFTGTIITTAATSTPAQAEQWHRGRPGGGHGPVGRPWHGHHGWGWRGGVHYELFYDNACPSGYAILTPRGWACW